MQDNTKTGPNYLVTTTLLTKHGKSIKQHTGCNRVTLHLRTIFYGIHLTDIRGGHRKD
jgi:hypothetical protein